MHAVLTEKRKADLTFTFSKDGVHPSKDGHVVMARQVAAAWGLKMQPDGTPDHPAGAAILAAVVAKQALLRPAWLSHVGHLRPGTKPGLPLHSAEEQAVVFDLAARRLAGQR